VTVGDVVASRFRLEGVLGTGAMGTVYRARHLKLSRPLAIKILHEHCVPSVKLRKRFEREALLAGKLRHTNVVGVQDVGDDDGVHYIVMDLCEGPTLGAVLDKGPLPADRMMAIVRQLCNGLEHAHNHGLVHRDFKPDNVIVERPGEDDERVRIVDFGISTLRDDQTYHGERLTTVGLTLGTPRYMAPEHVTGQRIDHRIDLFALGVVCFEMLTGRAPFDGDGVEVARANLLEEPPAMAERAPGIEIDPLLEAFTRRLLAKNPDERPSSAFAARLMLDLIARDRATATSLLLEVDRPTVMAQGSNGISPPITNPIPEIAADMIHLPPHLTPQIRTPMPLPRGLFKRLAPWVAAGAIAVTGGIAVAHCAAGSTPSNLTRPEEK
jgi:serine/threonine protein kinase